MAAAGIPEYNIFIKVTGLHRLLSCTMVPLTLATEIQRMKNGL